MVGFEIKDSSAQGLLKYIAITILYDPLIVRMLLYINEVLNITNGTDMH